MKKMKKPSSRKSHANRVPVVQKLHIAFSKSEGPAP
tara:strand:- start:470 stop:577 length:108 start_codon:yes stop_codon:yes gene_type:complete